MRRFTVWRAASMPGAGKTCRWSRRDADGLRPMISRSPNQQRSGAGMSVDVVLYTTPNCSYCVQAKQLLVRKGVAYREIDVSRDGALRTEVMARSGQRT